MANLDNITEIRIAEFPLGSHPNLSGDAAALALPATIFSDTNASIIETSSLLDANGNDTTNLRALADGWKGADAPTTAHVKTNSGSGQGQARRRKKYNGRMLTMPISQHLGDTGSPTNKERLDDNIIPAESYVIGFRRANAVDNRYLISCAYEGGLDRSYRGEGHRSNFRLNSGSTWPWVVSYNSASGRATFTAPGKGELLWGVLWTTSISSTLTISVASTDIGNTSSTYTWGTGGAGSTGIICESFPFEEHTGSPAISGATPVPQYLIPGEAYTIIAPGCTIWWLENHLSI